MARDDEANGAAKAPPVSLESQPSPRSEAATDETIEPSDRWLEGPGGAFAASTVWIAVVLPDDHADGTLALRLLRAGLVPHSRAPRIFVRKTLASPRPLAHMIEALVGNRGSDDLRMAVIVGDDEPSLTEIHAELLDLASTTARLRAQWLMPLFVSRRVFAMLMPLFDAKGDIVAEEALGRGEVPGGELILGGALFEAARDLDLVAYLDRLVRVDAFIAFSRAYRFSDPRLIVRVSPEALRDPSNLVKSLVELMRCRQIHPSRVLIEVEQSALAADRALHSAVEEVRAAGVGLSLSGLCPGPSATELVATLRPEHAKLDGALLRAAARAAAVDDDAARPQRDDLASLADAAAAAGAKVVASGIESQQDLALAQTLGAVLFSGFLLCRPRRL